MSFTIKQKIETTLNFKGLVSEVPFETREVDVTYDVVSVVVDKDATTARYIAIIGGVSSELKKLSFDYQGGDPISEADEALKSSLTNS
ncbi:hypothetical protein RBJ04_07155 [Klebsiella michiganensis]|uniref:hypothetical protein n=1 Tax=Klebsiella michiganensis TaxID=1134687 RepID=UPI0027D1B479|nr:hypothetical protein [Klebsiella michiganensis]MDQ2563327.1 hypothetical protein [Klebsiella michiganensis]